MERKEEITMYKDQLETVYEGTGLSKIRTAHPIITKLVYDNLYKLDGYKGEELVFYHILRICNDFGLLDKKLAKNSKAYMIYSYIDDESKNKQVYIDRYKPDKVDGRDILGMISVDYDKPFHMMMDERQKEQKISIKYAPSMDTAIINVLKEGN